MKRYTLETEYNCDELVVPVEDTFGDWVKWVDVCDFMIEQLHNDARNQILIESLRKENEQLQQALRGE